MSPKPELIMVAGKEEAEGMGTYLLAGDRDHPAIAVTMSSTGEPVLALDEVRAIVGSARIYVVAESGALERLQGVLGRDLALPAGAARIWWPELTAESNPMEHPLVLELEDEPDGNMLAEFVRCFELSRPTVRREIRLIEGVLGSELEETREQLRRVSERLREAEIKGAEQQTHTAQVEARLEAATRELDALRGPDRLSAGGGSGLG